MPVFRLTRALAFPSPALAEEEGILAIGGDLSVNRLLLAYRSGIFPWYASGDPILWWSPDPRLVLFPDKLRVSHSLRRVVRGTRFRVTVDHDFPAVIRHCSKVMRKGQPGTWITPEMERAYVRLHTAGHAHSVETWRDDRLVGGLYGVVMGRCFCGESMFALEPDASKRALVTLVTTVRERGGTLIDCQVPTDHLKRLGAEEIPRPDFLERLAGAVTGPACFP